MSKIEIQALKNFKIDYPQYSDAPFIWFNYIIRDETHWIYLEFMKPLIKIN